MTCKLGCGGGKAGGNALTVFDQGQIFDPGLLVKGCGWAAFVMGLGNRDWAWVFNGLDLVLD